MGKKKSKSIYKSRCCNAKVKSVTSPDEIDKLGCTMVCVCTECNKPCDIYIPERKTWAINPKTRIVPNKKKKNNKLFTDKELKKFHQEEDF